MKLFRNKQPKLPSYPNENLGALTACQGYFIEPYMVISMPDRMIVRIKLRMPVADDDNVEIVAKNENQDYISLRIVFLGKEIVSDEVSGFCVFKELTFSIFVPYPEQNLIFEVRGLEGNTVVHQQRIDGDIIARQRAADDQVFYRFAEDDPTYTDWLTKEHRPSEYELEVQRKSTLDFEPQFSIVVPLYKTPIRFFNELVECIKEQTYSKWELILVNASADDKDLCRVIDEACEDDCRIKSIVLEENEGITLNTAHGIDLAKGDFVCFVDHDDVIEPNCLFEYALTINNNPNAELLYCDEDLLLPDGSYSCAYFKPDFNEFQLRTSNYVCHMLTIKRELLMQLEFNNPAYDGAQDHHLTLQASEKAKAIEHVSKVLYHWRMSETSVAGAGSEKPYAVEAGLRAVSNHLKRIGIRAKVESHEEILLTTKIDYELPDDLPKVSIVVPARAGSDLNSCIESILNKTTYRNYDVVVVSEGHVNLGDFKDDEKIEVHNMPTAFNYSEYINEGRKKANSDFLIVLESNVEILTPKWIENMLGICVQSDVGIVGGKILLPDDTLESAGVFIGNDPYPYFQNLPNGAITFKDYAKQVRNVSAVSPACMMIDTKIFDEVGGLTESLETYLGGVDLCFRVTNARKKIVYTPYSEVCHFVLPAKRCSCEPQKKKVAIKEKGILHSTWPEIFLAHDVNQNVNIAQGWRGAYYSLRD